MDDNLVSSIPLFEYIELYADKNDLSKFIFGKIVSRNSFYIIISAVTPNGHYDGFVLKRIEDIIKICRNTKYKEKLLCKIDESKIKKFDNSKTENLIAELLSFAKDNNLIASIEILESGYNEAIGLINEICDNYVSIKHIAFNGEFDGITYLNTKDITQISVDSEEERNW